MPYKKF